MLMTVPRVRTELGKKAFVFSAPSALNSLQNELSVIVLVLIELGLYVFPALLRYGTFQLIDCFLMCVYETVCTSAILGQVALEKEMLISMGLNLVK